MWDQATKRLRENDDLIVLGVVQEQHAERARLYAQWKEFDWPIVQDQMNSIGIAVVPVAILIDEFGIVQSTRPQPNQIGELVAEARRAPEQTDTAVQTGSSTQSQGNHSVQHQVKSGDMQLISGDFEQAISSYTSALQTAQSLANEPRQQVTPVIQFRMGVAFRAKYDAETNPNPKDFATAAKYWTTALQGNPNQYIWRRRIEQYGPRSIKPYPFYDWVDQAIGEIKERGEKPVDQRVVLSGAEIAQPSKQPLSADKEAKNPDSESKVARDDSEQPLIEVASVVVPSQIEAGKSVRVHLTFTCGTDTQWNNETSPMRIWIDESKTGVLSKQLIEIPNSTDPSSAETRTVEFEFQTTDDATRVELTGFALANVCTGEEGQCLFRRRDFVIKVPISR